MLGFRKLRKKLLKQHKIGRYLQYAVGEILLVVIGILIAVSINNWNERQKKLEELDAILATILEEMAADTAQVRGLLDHYQKREATFLQLLNDSLSREKIAVCSSCPSLILNYASISIETKGYELLKDYTDQSNAKQDSLVTQIVQFYSGIIYLFEKSEDRIERDILGNMEQWRDSQPWFANLLLGKPDDRFVDYAVNNPEYKNKVALHYALVYQNHLPALKAFQFNAGYLIGRIKERLE